MKVPMILASSALLTLSCLSGCNQVDENGDEFATVIPSEQTLALSLEEEATPAEAEEEAMDEIEESDGLDFSNSPARLRQHTENLLKAVNALRTSTREKINTLTSNVEPIEIELDNLQCKQWHDLGETNEWKLTSCQIDRRLKSYKFELAGKPIDAGDEAYLTVFKGKGSILKSNEEGKVAKKGAVGYNFDNIAIPKTTPNHLILKDYHIDLCISILIYIYKAISLKSFLL